MSNSAPIAVFAPVCRDITCIFLSYCTPACPFFVMFNWIRKLHRWRSKGYVRGMSQPIHRSASTNATCRESLIWEHFYIVGQVRGCHLVFKEAVYNNRNKELSCHFEIENWSLYILCLYFCQNQFIIWITSNVIWLAFLCINIGKLWTIVSMRKWQ